VKIAPNDPFEVAILLPIVGFAYILSLVHLHTNTYLKSVYLLSSLGFAHILSSVHLRANFCYWSLCLDIHFLWTGKHCCVPSVRSCSHLFHYSEIKQGSGRAENGKSCQTYADFFNWFGAGLGPVLLSMSHEIWISYCFLLRAEPFLLTIQMSVSWGCIWSDLQRYLSLLLVNFIL